MNFSKKNAFTLIELLTVIAIIAILAGILIPTIGAAKKSALKAKTKVQFSQWASAMTLFKQEYGYYPSVAASGSSAGLLDTSYFLADLTARDYQGNVLSGANLKANIRALSFYSVSDSELLKSGSTVQNTIVDAFGNSDIMVMVDSDGNGVIKGSERKTSYVAPGNSVDGKTAALSSGINTDDIQSGVAFYSAGAGNSINDYVYSWK